MSEHTTGVVVARRAVLASAAWSVPVIAAAAMTPSAAASLGWRVSLGAGCLSGVIGADPAASFTVTETQNVNANLEHAFSEHFSQEFTGEKIVFSADAAQEEAATIVQAVLVQWNAFRTNAALQGQSSPKIHRSPWPELSASDLTVRIRDYGVAYGAEVTLTATRSVTVDPLSASERIGWGYHASVLSGLALSSGVANVTNAKASLTTFFTANSQGGSALAVLGRDGFSGC